MRTATAQQDADRHQTIHRLVGRQLMRERIRAGLSVTELATKLGIAPEQLRSYETGVDQIPILRLVSFAEGLGVPVALFFSTVDSAAAGPSAEGARLDHRLTAAIRRLPEDLRTQMLGLVEAIADLGPNAAAAGSEDLKSGRNVSGA